MFNVLDFMHRMRKSYGIKYYPEGQYVPKFRKNLRSEFEINVAYYPIVEMV